MIGAVDKFNMVDMGGIDIVESQGVAVDGLFSRLLTAIQNCRYQVLYNWKFAQIEIPPSYVELLFDGERVSINGAVTVTEDNVVRIYSLELAIQELHVTENGTYRAEGEIAGYSPVTVEIPTVITLDREPTENDGRIGDYCISSAPVQVDGFCVRITKAGRGSSTTFTYWGTSAFRAVVEDDAGIEHNIADISGRNIALSPYNMTYNTTKVNSLFTASPTGNYEERNPLPGYFVVRANNFYNYRLKSISFCRRPGASYQDYVVDFSVYYIKNYQMKGNPLLTVSGLKLADWPSGTLVDFQMDSNDLPIGYSLYFKKESGWEFVTQWD